MSMHHARISTRAAIPPSANFNQRSEPTPTPSKQSTPHPKNPSVFALIDESRFLSQYVNTSVG